MDAIRSKKIEEIKKQRQDAKLRGVQINETEERDKAKQALCASFWEVTAGKFDALVRLERQAVEEEAAAALPKLLPSTGRLPERGFSKRVEEE